MEYDWRDFKARHGGVEGARAAFETACESLLRRMNSDETVQAVRPSPGDDGIDILVGEIGIEPIHVYQCKFFLEYIGKSQKAQITRSFERARSSGVYQLASWTLCLPMVLSIRENIWWAKFKRQSEASGISLDLLNGDQLLVEARRSGILQDWFRSEDSSVPNRHFVPRNLPFRSLLNLLKGRDIDLQRISESLKLQEPMAISQPQTIHGLGGIGKTRLAIEYAWGHLQDYSAVLFVSSNTRRELNASLAGLTKPDILDLREVADTSEELQRDTTVQWLQRNPGLIIFDNVDTADGAEAVQQLIPRLGNGYILITSRIRNWPLSILQLPLDVIGSEEGASFILESTEGVRRAEDDDVSVAKRLSALLGGLPLALAHSAAYIAHHEIGLAEYIEIFENHLDRVLQFHDSSAMEYGTSVHQLGSVKTIATTVSSLLSS